MDQDQRQAHTDAVLATYRYLRVAMPLLAVLLGAAVALQIFAPHPSCWLGSVSAYYYTSARAVFVAALCAIGVCLIAYRGNSPREDVALNVSGFLAFLVAFIPTPLRDLRVDGTGVPEAEPICTRSNVPTNEQLVAAIDNNVLALACGAFLMLAFAWWLWLHVAHSQRVGSLDLKSLVASSAVWAVLVPTFVFGDRTVLRETGHLISAVALFAGIVLVILMNAWDGFRGPDAPPPTRAYELHYRGVAITMLVLAGGLGLVYAVTEWDHVIFWLEVLGIGGFAWFWVVQTKELWGQVARGVAPAAQKAGPGQVEAP